MYKPDRKSRIYLYVIFIVASLVGWFFFIYSKPLITETACSEIASKSTYFVSKRYQLDPENSYENIKSRCLEESLSKN